jgi:capsular exopolysaccharide synthesis family protein
MNQHLHPSGLDPLIETNVAESSVGDPMLSSQLVMLSEPEGVQAESIRQLRTRLISQHLDVGRRSLTMCSPSPESGCSFIAANLAVAFAQVGLNVLLVNADMREPGLDALFGISPERPGLVHYLSSAAEVHDLVGVYDLIPKLSLVPSGGQSPRAQELLSGARFSDFLNNTLRQFDLTIVDTPPTDLYADAQRVAAMTGYCAIVARTNRTRYGSVAELARQLQKDRVQVVGTILNQY